MGGSTFVRRLTLPDLLSITYAESTWLPWKFRKCGNKFWSDAKNQTKFMEWAANELNIKEMGDWYNVTTDVMNFCNYKSLLYFLGFIAIRRWTFVISS